MNKDIEICQRRPWHPTPVLLPGKSHGRRSLVGCHPWGRTGLDTTKVTLSSSSSIEICMLGREKGMATWRREWLPTPIFLPGASHGQRSLAGYI